MNSKENSIDKLLTSLKERAKELNCLYEIEELFSNPEGSLPDILQGIVRAIPPGWQYPDVCEAKIDCSGHSFQSQKWKETPWMMKTDIAVQNEVLGSIHVCYTDEMPAADEGPFLKEERRLINTIADRLERRLFHERMKTVFEKGQTEGEHRDQSSVILDLLKKTDARLLARIYRKMLNLLSWSGIPEVKKFLAYPAIVLEESVRDGNQPIESGFTGELPALTDEIFSIAREHLGEKKVLHHIESWIVEDRSNFLMKVVEDPRTSLADVINAIERFQHHSFENMELSPSRDEALRVGLIRRLLTDEPAYIRVAKPFLEVADFHQLWRSIIFPAGSHGKIGGKGSGIFLAQSILRKTSQYTKQVSGIKTPGTLYLTSDTILQFIHFNDLEEMMEQKYDEIDRVRQEYPYIVHVFKNSPLPAEIVNGLSAALDEFGEKPLIVRSSSLLEDRLGASFAGKYKSLFLANQGTKQERLKALIGAITEVYASTFNPDAIEYRAEHGMIDFHEEMAILIQEVVGTRVGPYFFPAFAGVAFSNNEFCWSQRIRREDGLLRIVPGLGTRAVDRLTDDYPILVSPAQPALSVNVTTEEKIRYSPRRADVLNLKTNSFETVDFQRLLSDCGSDYPMFNKVLSVEGPDGLKKTGLLNVNNPADRFVVTFDGLFNDTDFLEQIRAVLTVLQSGMKGPVDVEFAHDGTDLYLLQCRYQSSLRQSQVPAIPSGVSPQDVIFSANRYITNGIVSGITHVVYVDPVGYTEIENRAELLQVGRAVGKLNQILPKRRFILMGPGRWGSRGDIKLGVSVSYADIKNAAMLIEIAKMHKGYMPELSFGTHFFQDLVESSIRYLPLYPDDPGVVLNEKFLQENPNRLPSLAPEFAHLQRALRVVDVMDASQGRVLQVLMNGERGEAIGLLVEP